MGTGDHLDELLLLLLRERLVRHVVRVVVRGLRLGFGALRASAASLTAGAIGGDGLRAGGTVFAHRRLNVHGNGGVREIRPAIHRV